MNTLYGVNLGGWLVVEKWMTPSLFKGTEAKNEYDLSQTEEGRARLRTHHETFITLADIKWLAKQKVEIVRLPIGHWIFGDAAPYVGAIERLDWLVKTTAKYNIQVLLDLHGAPGAQNTKEHSGSGNRNRSAKWLDNKAAQEKTIATLVRIAQRYRDSPNIWGIELLNEPATDKTGLKLARFYRNAYREIIKHARPGTKIIFSDGFKPLLLTNTFGLMKKRDFPVIMDCHFYHCFGKANKQRSFEDHLKRAGRIDWFIRILSLMQPVVAGEWSGMLPYSVSSEATKQFLQVQQHGFRRAQAMFYWSYKTESGGRWNFRDMTEHGRLSNPKG